MCYRVISLLQPWSAGWSEQGLLLPPFSPSLRVGDGPCAGRLGTASTSPTLASAAEESERQKIQSEGLF